MRFKTVCTLLLLGPLLCQACRGQGESTPLKAKPVRIHRFDQALFRLIESDNDTGIQGELLCDYPEMLEVVGKGVLNMPTPETSGFFDRLQRYYAEPTLRGLYRDALALYDSIAAIEQELGEAFAYLEAQFPAMPLPQVYMHVSGLNQNILVADKLLSVSIDKYMGKDYPLYRSFFYDFQREKMQTSRIVPDYLSGWLLSEYPFEGNESVLLERMIYEGKIKYLLSQALPGREPHEWTGFTEEAYEWCRTHEQSLWKTIVERKHLYTPDPATTNKYMDEAPATFLEAGAPGSPGVWIGWQIVCRYMKQSGSSPEKLMRHTKAQEILAISGYNPF
jgi:hypothetical protein